jgi:hypothetical protein
MGNGVLPKRMRQKRAVYFALLVIFLAGQFIAFDHFLNGYLGRSLLTDRAPVVVATGSSAVSDQSSLQEPAHGCSLCANFTGLFAGIAQTSDCLKVAVLEPTAQFHSRFASSCIAILRIAPKTLLPSRSALHTKTQSS